MLHPILRRGLAPMWAVAFVLLTSLAGATTLVQMNLKDLAGRSDKVFRGTVLSAKVGTVKAGGGELPTVTYKLKVEEAFKGDFPAAKDGGDAIVEVRMVGALKDGQGTGAVRRVSILRDVPRLAVGQDYVLFTTRPSSIGLSTTVGLGQGAFTIMSAGKDEQAVNAFNNLGLARGLRSSAALPARGPVPYAQLAQAIRSVLSE